MKRHALFVGVDSYADRNIQDLHCAVNDATELAGFFKHRACFDRAEALPNPRACDDVLERVHDLLDGLGPGDEFLFFFAGHGIKTQDGHRLVCAGDLLADVKHGWAGLPLEMLKFKTAGTFDRLFLLDACRTDVLATNRGVAGAMENGTRDLILSAATPAGAGNGALTILCSCDDGECAGEILSFRHGLFSMAMLELLDEESRCGRSVFVTDDFAYNQIPVRMRALAEKSDMVFNQRPQKNGPPILLLDGVVAPTAPPACAHKKIQLWESGPYWADTNIGAQQPWEPGYYFWWGGTIGYERGRDRGIFAELKKLLGIKSVVWVARNGQLYKEEDVLTRNKDKSALQDEGWITHDGVLAPNQDVAHVQWGEGWRMPTERELINLFQKCDCKWVPSHNVGGVVVKGKGDYASSSIFLPVSDYSFNDKKLCGSYWSAVPYETFRNYSWALTFDSAIYRVVERKRIELYSVRPVQG